jgi:hypothetical protein
VNHRDIPARAGLRRTLASRSGAFDLQSVLVGAVVTGILAGGTFATIFGVLPWGQNTATQQSLETLHAAQSSALTGNDGYMDTAALIGAGFLEKTTASVTDTNAAKTCYVGLSKSDTGTIYYVTSTAKDPAVLAAAATNVAGACLTTAEFAALKATIGTTPGSGAVVLAAPLVTEGDPVGTTVEFSWTPVPGAEAYIVEYATSGTGWLSFDADTVGTSARVNGRAGAYVKVRVQAKAGTTASAAAYSDLEGDGGVLIPSLPGKPVLSVAAVTGQAKFTWPAVTNATSYSVEFRINGGPWQVRARNQDALSAVVNTADGDTVEVQVAAANSTGTSAWVTKSVLV